MDFRLTDSLLDPRGMFDSDYSEKSVRLPETFWCYQPLDAEIEINSAPALENGYITFGGFNAFSKVNPQVLLLWAKVLQAVPNSRLLLLAEEGTCRQTVIDVLQREQIEGGRVAFVARQERARYLLTYHRLDIGLDTFPANGHTTTMDSLWMGVPVITRVGDSAMGRGGLSILTNIGCEDLIAHSDEEFVRCAVQLASSLDRLVSLRQSLRTSMKSSPLMDAGRFARNVEAAYRAMWCGWCQGAV
jgi:predicted O-linked N-acetylglucosamine transferase (SPINDLY family)